MIPNRFAPHLFVPSLMALFLACSALSAPAHAGWLFGSDDDSPQKTQAPDKPVLDRPPATDVDGNVRQAHMLRLAGQYKEAIHHLAQLMLVASDDGRVVAEYGKTLAQMGRAQDAVSFLTRATQLRADDWTVFSALGVAFDELGEQDKAKDAYERALALKPDEPTVLNNYALSRLLAHDPQGAHALAARIQAADGEKDPKIARNLAMIADMAPAPTDNTAPAPAKATPAPAKVATAASGSSTQTAKTAQTGFVAATPQPGTAQKSGPAQATAVAANTPFVSLPVAAPVTKVQATPLPGIQAPVPASVVMQKVPQDPKAGPVATQKPRKLAKAEAPQPEAAPETGKVHAVATSVAEQIRDSVPALRLSANAY